jgi:hypothetical protein
MQSIALLKIKIRTMDKDANVLLVSFFNIKIVKELKGCADLA